MTWTKKKGQAHIISEPNQLNCQAKWHEIKPFKHLYHMGGMMSSSFGLLDGVKGKDKGKCWNVEVLLCKLKPPRANHPSVNLKLLKEKVKVL